MLWPARDPCKLVSLTIVQYLPFPSDFCQGRRTHTCAHPHQDTSAGNGAVPLAVALPPAWRMTVEEDVSLYRWLCTQGTRGLALTLKQPGVINQPQILVLKEWQVHQLGPNDVGADGTSCHELSLGLDTWREHSMPNTDLRSLLLCCSTSVNLCEQGRGP